ARDARSLRETWNRRARDARSISPRNHMGVGGVRRRTHVKGEASMSLETFRKEFGGQALTPGHADYDGRRSVWDGAIDRKPAVIARCTTAAHVADAIRYAKSAGLEIAVRGGGHNYAGHAVCDGGMMIHLGAMNGVDVNPDARRAKVGGGATWADLDAATQ